MDSSSVLTARVQVDIEQRLLCPQKKFVCRNSCASFGLWVRFILRVLQLHCRPPRDRDGARLEPPL